MDNKKLYTQKGIRECIKEMLSLVEKEGCRDSKNKISAALSWIDEDNESIMFHNTDFAKFLRIGSIGDEALSYLRRHSKKNQAKKNRVNHVKFLKKITAFRDSLKESVKLMKDPAVAKLLKHKANEHAKDQKILQRYHQMLNVRHVEHDAAKNYLETYHRMLELHEEMSRAVLSNSHKMNKGRPSLETLYKYVYELAVLYKDLSKENFSIFRHKGEKGEYEPVTDGHKFIYIAIQLLNNGALDEGYNETYTDKNIYNACENAQKRLSLSSQ